MEAAEEKNAVVEEVLQSPDKEIPLSLSLSLGPPNLSSAVDFPTHTNPNSTPSPNPQSPSIASLPNHHSPRSDLDSGDLDRSDNGEIDDDDLVQTKKKRKTVWTPELHNKFAEAVAHLGVRNAAPKTILATMNVDGLTWKSVASHWQIYKKYLRRMSGLDNSGDKRCKKMANSARNSTADRQFVTLPLPFPPAPAGYNVATSLQQQQYYHSRNMRQIVGNVGAFHPGFLDIAPPIVDEKSEEGYGEIKELPPFPTGKD